MPNTKQAPLSGSEMRLLHWTTCLLMAMMLGPCLDGGTAARAAMTGIIIDYPHGATSLRVCYNGEAYLFYGALPRYQRVRNHTFDMAELYRQVQDKLYDNAPRQTWPQPKATAGMVTINFDDKPSESYLIFDQEEFAEALFTKARENIVDHIP